MIKVIAFDLWNTLATTKDKSSFGNSVKKIFDVKKTISEIRDIFEETIQTKFWETEYDANKEFCRNLEIAPTEKNVFKMIALREKRKKDVKLFDETIPLLKKIKEKGYKIGLVSNTSLADYDKVVNKLKVLKYIDYPVFSFQVGVVKPDSIIYLELQRKAMVYNNEILMVGDNYEHDVLAPKKLGMNAIYFDKNFNKLKELLAKIKVSRPRKLKTANRFDSDGERPSLPILALILLVLMLLFGIFFAVWWYFPKAELVLSVMPKYSEDNVSLLVATSASSINIEEKIIPAHQVSVQVKKTDKVDTTGEDLVGDKAAGEVMIYNRTTIERTFDEGTVIASSDGLRFLTKNAITVEPAVIDVDEDYNQVTTPSKETVAIVADDIGADYNLSAGQELAVDSFIKDSFVAKNEKVFSGGSSQKVKVVAEEDRGDLKERVLAIIKDQGEQELMSQLASGEKLIKESVFWEPVEEEFSHGVGDETDRLTLALTAKLTGLAYWDQDLNSLIEALLEAQVPSGFVLGEEKKADFKFVEKQEAGVLFNLSFGASLYPDIDEAEVKKKIAGRKLGTIEDYLSLLPSVDSSEVHFSPPLPNFLLTLPHRADNITIRMEVGE